MPPTRKRRSTKDEIVAPGGGTQADVIKLAKNLNMTTEEAMDMLHSNGSGLLARSSRRASAEGAEGSTAPAVQSSAWADFMDDEGFGNDTATTTTATNDAEAEGDSKRIKTSNDTLSNQTGQMRDYILPIKTSMKPPSSSLSKKKKSTGADESEEYYKYITPGILAQTGSLDAKMVGRTKRTLDQVFDLQEPTILALESSFHNQKVACIATSSSACHSIVISEDGSAYSWGRNEEGQCGHGMTSAFVPLPKKIEFSGKFVGAAVGKNHSLLVEEGGNVYAVGNNKYGQCGVNRKETSVSNWRKCVMDNVKIVQAACGENFSVLLDENGIMYSAGLSEFGQLGNGETGEYFIAANKLGFANSLRFERRSRFVHKPPNSDAVVSLPDSERIRIASIACGKNHTVAVEAMSRDRSQTPRVFTWGCGGYGVLGHNVQADEYTPRLVSGMVGPLFQNNPPVKAAAGSHCSMILTENGHVYYSGKHRSVGESAMRPKLLDDLANNMHVVTALSGGSETIFMTTKNGVTVSSGKGQHGELGYGIGNPKSSAQTKFVDKLDQVIVTDLACGYGHTLFLIRNEDAEDKKALEKMSRLESNDVAAFVKKWS